MSCLIPELIRMAVARPSVPRTQFVASVVAGIKPIPAVGDRVAEVCFVCIKMAICLPFSVEESRAACLANSMEIIPLTASFLIAPFRVKVVPGAALTNNCQGRARGCNCRLCLSLSQRLRATRLPTRAGSVESGSSFLQELNGATLVVSILSLFHARSWATVPSIG